MSNQSPFRKPCKLIEPDAYAYNPTMVTGGCQQHHVAADTQVPLLENSTRVPDYHATPGADIPPYMRRLAAGADPACGTPDSVPCGEWFPVPPNTYTSLAPATGNFSTCKDTGWKAVRATKVWHGRIGIKYCSDAALSTKYLSSRAVVIAGQRTAHIAAETAFTAEDLTVYQQAKVTLDATVDRHSGEITLNESKRELLNDYPYTYPGTFQCYKFIVGDYAGSGSDMWGTPAAPLRHSCIGDDIDTGTLPTTTPPAADPYAEYIKETRTATTTTLTWERILTAFTWDSGASDWQVTQQFWKIEITLADAYTLEQVADDWRVLHETWQLSSDAVHPWRTDKHCSIVPLVTRNEKNTPCSPTDAPLPPLYDDSSLTLSTIDDYTAPTAGSGTIGDPYTAWEQIAWKDLTAWRWYFADGSTQEFSTDCTLVHWLDGAILGAPAAAGVDKVFDFRAVQYNEGFTEPCGSLTIKGYGAWSTDVRSAGAMIPKCATQWTTCADLKAQGWTNTTANGITGQIYCEAKETWPSQNFFRPAGEDRAKTDAAGVALWPKAWGILGRETVTVADDGGGSITFTLPASGTSENGLWPSRVLLAGDTVRIFDADMTALGDVVIVSLADANHFTCTASFATYTTASYAMGGHDTRSMDDLPHYALNDTASKGQFIFVHQTVADAGASAVTVEQHCICPTPCAPSVLSIGYTRHDFPNGKNFPFPSVTTPATLADTQIYKAAIIQRMPDLLNIPTVDCTGDCERPGCVPGFCDKDIDAVRPANYPLEVNAGIGDGEITRNAPKIPWVEAMKELPEAWLEGMTVPALPTLAAGEMSASNPLAPAAVLPTYYIPTSCINGVQMKAYYMTDGVTTLTYLDAPWTDTTKSYLYW